MIFLPASAKVDGLVFPLANLPIPRRKKRHLARGDYETPERTLVKAFMKPGMKVLEFGGSIGILSCFIARAVGSQGALLSVEADASLLPFWKRNLSSNRLSGNCVNAVVCPIWTETVPANLLKASFSACEDKLSGRVQASEEKAQGTHWKTALNICMENQFFPDAMVVDIEGMEAVWIDQTALMPHEVKLIIAEFHPQYTGPGRAGESVQTLIDQGFKVVGYQNHVMAFAR